MKMLKAHSLLLGVFMVVAQIVVAQNQKSWTIEKVIGQERVSLLGKAQIVHFYQLTGRKSSQGDNSGFENYAVKQKVSVAASQIPQLEQFLMDIYSYDLDNESKMCPFVPAYGIQLEDLASGEQMSMLIPDNCNALLFKPYQGSDQLLVDIDRSYPKLESLIKLSLTKMQELKADLSKLNFRQQRSIVPLVKKEEVPLETKKEEVSETRNLSKAWVGMINTAQKVRVVHVASRKSKSHGNVFRGYPILNESVHLKKKDQDVLNQMLLGDQIYLKGDDTKSCLFTPDIGIEFEGEAQKGQVLLSFNCDLMVFYQIDEKGKRIIEDVDPGRATLLSFMKEVFPKKSLVQRIQ